MNPGINNMAGIRRQETSKYSGNKDIWGKCDFREKRKDVQGKFSY